MHIHFPMRPRPSLAQKGGGGGACARNAPPLLDPPMTVFSFCQSMLEYIFLNLSSNIIASPSGGSISFVSLCEQLV